MAKNKLGYGSEKGFMGGERSDRVRKAIEASKKGRVASNIGGKRISKRLVPEEAAKPTVRTPLEKAVSRHARKGAKKHGFSIDRETRDFMRKRHFLI